MKRTLDDWLRWQERLHPSAIELGLERVGRVWRALDASFEGIPVITVAGTNGKGSTIALLEAILGAAGYRIGSYTSPHLLRYNERIRLDGQPMKDGELVEAFEAIDRARGDTPLTYFEFGTLAALWLLARARVEAALLEVGLGGRLDAVNLVDPDVAVISSIGLDHQEWLGDDLEAIGREKAGIFRPKRPAVLSSPHMPESVAKRARALEAPLWRNGIEFRVEPGAHTWIWIGSDGQRRTLPRPGLPGEHQLNNAAGVVMALELLQERLPVAPSALEAGLRAAHLPGRQQALTLNGTSWILDVAHNPQAAAALASRLAGTPVAGRTHLLLAMLADKAAADVMDRLRPQVQQWHFAPLEGPRGRSARSLAALQPGRVHPSVGQAVYWLLRHAGPHDRVVVTGSFLTVSAAMETLQAAGVMPAGGRVPERA